MDYLAANKELWNKRTEHHVGSAFYDMESFMAGKNSLKEIELPLLGNVQGKSILHLQCHFGQDSLSLARMGAQVTGIDLSDAAITKAREINTSLGTQAEFICCDVYSLKEHLHKKFDIVFTSYGTIGWLPDMDQWAGIVQHFLNPGGEFIMAEFHPLVWMYNNEFTEIGYSYFNTGPIIEESTGTYTDRNAPIQYTEYGWNHALEEVFTALLNQGLQLQVFKEYNYSPYNCFSNMVQEGEDCYVIPALGRKAPMVYAMKWKKPEGANE
jgi:SAM-dependent methyltransferase